MFGDFVVFCNNRLNEIIIFIILSRFFHEKIWKFQENWKKLTEVSNILIEYDNFW